MKIYVINGKDGIGKTDFAVNLAEHLQKLGRVLLLQGKRNGRSNIEDYFGKDGMITYDIADYFQDLAPIEKVLVHETQNLDFMISPLLEEKYSFNSQDMGRLFSEVNYDFVVIDELAGNIIPEKTAIEIVGMDNINDPINADAFFINKVSDTYDIRNDKDIIDGKGARFLGTVKEGEYFKPVIDNLLSENAVAIPKLGFFEKLRLGFRK